MVVVTQIFEHLMELNLILWVIGGCSVLSFAIFLERIRHLSRSEVDTNHLLIQLRQAISSGNRVEAVRICEDTGGTVARIIQAGISRYSRGRKQVESAMEIRGMVEIAKLERNAKVLSIIAHIAPLIGLLGTVLGFIQAFSEMRLAGMVDISATRIGEAMEYALVTTAAGLVVAIPTVVAYNYIVSRIQGFVLEIQTTSSEIIDLLESQSEEGWGISSPPL